MEYKDELAARINTIIEHFAEGRPTNLARILDIHPDTLGFYIGKKGKISNAPAEFISKLVDKLRISSDWILLGKGEMMQDEPKYKVTQIYEPETSNTQEKLDQAIKLIATLQKTLDLINNEFSKTNEELEILRTENSHLKNMLADTNYYSGGMVAETVPELNKNKK